MKLITEQLEDIDYITEGTGDKKNVYISGIFMQAEAKNKNKRIYPKPVLESAVDKYIKEWVNTGRAGGELNHPSGPAINPDRISHRITELKWDGNNVLGKALVVNTPMGNIVKGLIEGGFKLGVSSRGLGSIVSKDGESYIDKDYILNTVDVVHDPSAHEAFVDGIMEGVEFYYSDNGKLAETSDKYRSIIKNLSSAQLAEQQIKLFAQFLKEI